jgi:ABC-type lipoprotein release transport system permease subunit
MKFWDIIRLALRNLRESKLRAGLTTVGVVVGVAVIVSMVSFGLGLQRNAVQRFRDLDLFNEITVSGRSVESLVSAAMMRRGEGRGAQPGEGRAGESDGRAGRGNPRGESQTGRVLDDAALAENASVPGVAAVEPSVNFVAYVRANKRVQTRSVGGASVPAVSTRFKTFAAGRMIASAEADEAVVDDTFLAAFGYEKADDAVGQTIEVLTDERAGAEDGGGAAAKGGGTGGAARGAGRDDGPMSFFGLPLEGGADEEGDQSHLSARAFKVVGVLKTEVEGDRGARRFRGFMPVAGIYLPLAQARELGRAQKGGLSRVALELARANGVLKEGEAEGYPLAVVRVSDPDVLTDVQKRLAERDFSVFSIVDQLKEIRTVFLILNSALGMLGGISLLVASFGIANTMIMSILERTREIGIMKAIGAEDREIKTIFFAEAALIGLAGGVIGTLVAWAISAVADRLAYRFILQPRGVAYVSFFALPPWLWAGAILFAVLVAIAAALYPAARAARIDPVKALRHD